MSTPKISILIPVYNVEKYLPICLRSLKNQTEPDLEFICINDGSTDGSLRILKDYHGLDKRFKIIDKPNSGYGDSMNQGIEAAKGEYIGIVEPDDYVDETAFAYLYQKAQNSGADLVRANYFHHSEAGDRKINNHDLNKVVKPAEDTALFREPPAIWSAIYRREFLNQYQIRFLPTPGASYQDTGFFLKTLAAADRVYLTSRAFLHYRVDNAGSSVKSDKKIFNVVKEYHSAEQFIIKNQLNPEFSKIFQATKFAAYCWNTSRLPRQTAHKFCAKIRTEFQDAEKQGNLERKYFPSKHWLALKLLLANPGLFADLLQAKSIFH